MNTMRSAVFDGDGRIHVERTSRPQPSSGEVRVRLHGCGVCASNLPVWAGRPWFRYPSEPGAPGHEGWGEIDEVGDGIDGWHVGDRVALLSGRAYAEYDVAGVDSIARLPSNAATRPLPGEPLACAMNIWRRSDIRVGHVVAIVGVGFIGALLIQLAHRAGARVIALSRRPFALDVARACGADEVLSTEDAHAGIGAVKELSVGGCARVIEAAGEQATLDIASGISAEGGRLIIAGYHQDGPRQVSMQMWNWKGIDVINAHERKKEVQVRGLREAVERVAEGTIDLGRLVTHAYPLERLGEALQATRDKPEGFVKAWVRLR